MEIIELGRWFYDEQGLNPYHAGTELVHFIINNIMGAEALAPCVSSTSAPMILTM